MLKRDKNTIVVQLDLDVSLSISRHFKLPISRFISSGKMFSLCVVT